MAGEAADAVDVGIVADVAAEVATEASIVSRLLCCDLLTRHQLKLTWGR